MSLVSDKRFETSVEYFKKGDETRTIAYGRTRDEVLADLQAAHGTSEDWEWDWVVLERRVPMGLPPAWVQVARRYDEYGEKV